MLTPPEDGYVSDLELYNESFDLAKENLEKNDGWPKRKFTAKDWKYVEDFHGEFMNAVMAHMAANHDTQWIDVRYDSRMAALQVKAHAVYRLGPTIRNTIGHILVIIRMIGMTTALFSLEAAIIGQQTSEVIKKIIDGYVRIDDEGQRRVFEAVLKMRAELVVVNHDALHGNDYESAYGKINPTKERIIESLLDDISKADVEIAIKGLLDKGVIKEVGSSYKLVF